MGYFQPATRRYASKCNVRVSNSRQDAVHMWELEEVDSASGGGALYPAPFGYPSSLYLGNSKITGQMSFFCLSTPNIWHVTVSANTIIM